MEAGKEWIVYQQPFLRDLGSLAAPLVKPLFTYVIEVVITKYSYISRCSTPSNVNILFSIKET